MKNKIKVFFIFNILNIIMWVTPFLFFFSGNESSNDEKINTIVSLMGFSIPVHDPYIVTAGFNSDDTVHNGNHSGVDYVPTADKTVISGSSGTVSYINDSCSPFGGYLGNYCGYGFGNYVVVKTEVEDSSYRIIYGHMSQISVKVGDIVKNGDKLGEMGNSGNSTGAHVHFQIEFQTGKDTYKAVNPIPLLELNNIETNKKTMMKQAEISEEDFNYVDFIISRESSWNYKAQNPSSSAYGLCQALPGDKMETIGKDWKTNPITQLKWCDGYAKARYGGWKEAQEFWKENNWW